MRYHPVFNLTQVILVSILFTSCATLITNPSHSVRLTTNIEAERITVNSNSEMLLDGKTNFYIRRAKEPMIIGIKSKDSLYQVAIKSQNTVPYLYDVIFTAGLATLIERKDPKRYRYQKYIYLEEKNNVIRKFRFEPNHKGAININFSLPYVNYIRVNTTDNFADMTGFLGLSAGVDYFYKQNTYLSVQAGAASNFLAPFPAPVKYGGKHEHASVLFAAIRNSHTIRSVDIGYGLSFSKYTWQQHNTDPAFVTKETNSSAMGLSFAGHYRITKNFRAGFLYQPSALVWDKRIFNNSDRKNYQHLFSLELLFKFMVRKGR